MLRRIAVLLLSACSLLAALPARGLAASPPPEVLVLVYHGVGPHKPFWVTPKTMQADLQLLLHSGYDPISMQAFEAYALHGGALPARPVLLTFDDGVQSVYQYVYPLTVRYHVPAVEFIIGSRIGRHGYLSIPELRTMQHSGLWSLQAHTYDMHGTLYGKPDLLAVYPGRSQAALAAAISTDVAREAQFFQTAGLPQPVAFAFPFGRYDRAALTELHRSYPLMFSSRPALALPGEIPIPRVDATSYPLPFILARYEYRLRPQTPAVPRSATPRFSPLFLMYLAHWRYRLE